MWLILCALLPHLALAAPQRGQNFLTNAGFETVAEARASGWGLAGKGYGLSTDARDGKTAIVCESDTLDQTMGAMQEVVLDPPIAHPFKVSGWSKAENAHGADYCLYMDVWYEDGTNLWGQRGDLDQGSHGWQKVEYVFDVAKPVTKIQYFVLFRRCTGSAAFDDLSLELAPFEVQSERVTPSLYGGNSIDYSATLSLPAKWTASVMREGQAVYSATGEGRGISLSWAGSDRAGTLLPGGGYVVRVEAKDDLLGETLRREARVRTKPGSGVGYVWWTESSMNRVLVNAMPPRKPKREARIALAGNEYESFQVAIRAAPGADLKGCTVEIGDLRRTEGHGATGGPPAPQIEWHQVGFVECKELWKHPKMTDATPGWWPDPLLKVSSFDVPAGTTQSIWFTVHAPAGTPAGEYRGVVTIRANGVGAGAPTYERREVGVPVRVTVYGFDLPTQPHLKTAFALMDGYLEKLYGKPLTPELRRRYGDYVLQHRLNPDDISRTDPPDIEDIAYYDERGLNAFNVINMVEPRGNRTWVCWSPLEVYTARFKENLIRRLDPYVAELKRRGLADKAYVYTFDERGEDFYPVMREYFGLIKERYGIPTLTTAKVKQDPQAMRDLNVDWDCPLSSVYRYDEAAKCREQGLQTWAYVCLGPRYPYANWLADDPLIEARVIWWQAYQQQMDGFLYWGLNIWGRANNDYLVDPGSDGPRLRWSICTGGDHSWLQGDGELLYAGQDGPIGCVRLDNIRDGIEDYEYLWKLAELEGSVEKAREACTPVTTSMTQFTRDSEEVSKQRERIARRIEALARG
jgi:hypothetical protein